ncbi:MAG: hypothetical protein V4553_10780 [Bacteroidota bacterium]
MKKNSQTLFAATLIILVTLSVSTASAQCNFVPAEDGRLLTYHFIPECSEKLTTLHITLEFAGSKTGKDTVELPEHWGDGTAIHAMTNLRTLDRGTTLSDGPTSGSKIVSHSPNAIITLSYDLCKDWTGPFGNPLQFHPVVMPQYFEINGSNGLLHPKLDGQDPVIVHFNFQKLPATWALATSFGTSTDSGDRCQSYSGKWRAVDRALFAAGDFRIHRFKVKESPVILAIRGQWTFSDADAISELQKTIGTVRDFWHDNNFPYFLVTLKPYDSDHGSSDGSGYTNAFWMYMSRLDPFSARLSQLAHEAFHTWNDARMGVETEGQKSIDWFHEGFTTYYGNTLVYHAGLITQADYLQAINLDLRRYSTSTSPYIRGHIIALWLDAMIRKTTDGKNSLDNIMFDLVRERDKPFTNAHIFDVIRRYLSPDLWVQLHQAVERGFLPTIPSDALGAGIYLSSDQAATFDLGFDYNATKVTGKITGVKADGTAYIAGLRDGQVIVKRSVSMDQPDKQVVLTVQADEGEKIIQYYPRGKVVLVPQFHIN